MRLGVLKVIMFEQRAHEFGLAFQYFVQHLLIVDMMPSLWSVVLR